MSPVNLAMIVALAMTGVANWSANIAGQILGDHLYLDAVVWSTNWCKWSNFGWLIEECLENGHKCHHIMPLHYTYYEWNDTPYATLTSVVHLSVSKRITVLSNSSTWPLYTVFSSSNVPLCRVRSTSPKEGRSIQPQNMLIFISVGSVSVIRGSFGYPPDRKCTCGTRVAYHSNASLLGNSAHSNQD